MKLTFYKYHGTGNDFIIIDNRQNVFDKTNTKLISQYCDRRFGIGADGLILLEKHKSCDFTMVYFNADGNESSMCGNGGRCIVHFANFLGVIKEKVYFEAIDGMHHATIKNDEIRLKMQDVTDVRQYLDYVILDTGSPHFVKSSHHINEIDLVKEGAKIRYSKPFSEKGINVNFVEQLEDDTFSVRTYERGVEDETLSCGTGVTAVALAMHYIGETEKNHIVLKTPGGTLQVTFKRDGDLYKEIWLIGPAVQVFKGEIVC
jgi:diaminopimelate epimerase